MHRLTARFLLLFALIGSLLPLAQAAAPAPPHACCLRKTHHCHDSASPENTVISATSGCNHDCCRAATTSQWAHPQPGMIALSVHNVDARIAASHSSAPATQLSASQSSRAPPQISLA